jgi:hypothetical protein
MLRSYAAKNNKDANWYNKQLRDLGIYDARLTNFDGTDAPIKEGKTGVIDFNTYTRNLSIAANKNPDLYQKGMNLAYARKGSYEIDGQKALERSVREYGGSFVTGADA